MISYWVFVALHCSMAEWPVGPASLRNTLVRMGKIAHLLGKNTKPLVGVVTPKPLVVVANKLLAPYKQLEVSNNLHTDSRKGRHSKHHHKPNYRANLGHSDHPNLVRMQLDANRRHSHRRQRHSSQHDPLGQPPEKQQLVL